MRNNDADGRDTSAEFADFWDHFQLLPWKWAETITSRFRYFVFSTLLAYGVFIFFTVVPAGAALPLKDYPSINVIFLGGILIGIMILAWRRKVPSIFQWLWQGERLEPRQKDLKTEYHRYLQEYQAALLSSTRPLALGILFIGGLCIFLAQVPQFLSENFALVPLLLIYLAYLIIIFWAFMACIVGWAFLITSLYIQNLPQRFAIKIQPGHPDQCGGLKPVGDFCIRSAIPLIVAGFVSGVISMSTWDNSRTPADLATVALFLLGPFAAITVFIPLWDIHNYMSQQKGIYADIFATQAMELQQTIRVHSRENGDFKTAEVARDKLELLQTLHPDKLPYPVWPFRFTDTLLAVFSPQILQTVIGFGAFVYNTFFKKEP